MGDKQPVGKLAWGQFPPFEFTDAELDRMDVVDNALHDVIEKLVGHKVDHNMEALGVIREVIEKFYVPGEKRMEFYPYRDIIEEFEITREFALFMLKHFPEGLVGISIMSYEYGKDNAEEGEENFWTEVVFEDLETLEENPDEYTTFQLWATTITKNASEAILKQRFRRLFDRLIGRESIPPPDPLQTP